MKPKIVPAILTDSKSDLQHTLDQLAGLTSWLSIDIADGVFVGQVTLSPAALAEVKIPFKLELHLMVNNPSSYLADCHKLGAQRVIFHIEAAGDTALTIDETKQYGLEVGLALNPETDLKEVTPFIDKVDAILLLAVNPGRQGQSFIPETIDRIKRLRIMAPKIKIEVDGGLNDQTIKAVAAAGADILVIGSAITKQDDVKAAIKNLKNQLSWKQGI